MEIVSATLKEIRCTTRAHVAVKAYLSWVPPGSGGDARMKGRTPEILTDCAKSALGLGIAGWIIAAFVCPILHVDYTNIRQLLALGSGATIGAVLSYIFRESNQFATRE
jgi:hypothetical protein